MILKLNFSKFAFFNVKNFTEKYLHWAILSVLCILLITLSFLSEGYCGGADNIYHYFFSRFAFKHPHFFLDLWGRPLFTILSSPFSQFGFQGLKIFNILAGLATSYISYLIVKKLKLTPPFLVILLVCFTPLYCIMLLTGLTEILFSLVLVLAVYYFFDEKYILSSIMISLVFFARNEGFIFLPLFLFAFLVKRKFKAIPFLATGLLFFSLIGSIYYKDLLWIIHNFPYSAHNPSYYKSGSFFHFFTLHEGIMGIPLEVLAGIGVLYLVAQFFSKDISKRTLAFYEFLLILAPLVIYVVFHSVLFWKGLGGSIGLDRVLAGVLPLGAILAMKGYHQVNKFLPYRWLKTIILIVFVFLVTRVNFLTYHYPVILDPEEKLEKQASAWFEKSPFAKEKVYYSDFNGCFFLDTKPVDLLDQSKVMQLHSINDVISIPPGCIVQWDAHFGPNECGIPRDSLVLNPHLKLVNYFHPDEPNLTLGGNLYEILFFLKLPPDKTANNYSLLDSLHSEKEKAIRHKILLSYDFETLSKGIDSLKISRDTVHSGLRSFRIDKNMEFGPALIIKCSDFSTLMEKILIRSTAFVFPTAPLQSDKVCLVFSLEKNHVPYQYESLLLNDLNLKVNQWNKISFTVHLYKIKSDNDILNIYLWNPGKKELYLDDFSVEALIP